MKRLLSLLLLIVLGTISSTWAAETDCLVHDPSTVVKHGGVYWIYGTGRNIRQFSSTDLRHWTDRGPVFPAAPAWVTAAVPENRNSSSWAPDVHFFHGTYFLYYCYSTFGRNTSGIGVATNPTLDPSGWVDQGPVIKSPEPDGFNAIDPCIFQDAAGNPWLSFGSFFSGIKLTALHAATGKRPREDSPVYTLAEHPQGKYNSIEASCVYYHQGWYFLFVNWDGCCAGRRSTYNIRVGRSRVVTGPYLDKEGRDMNQGGGTLFLGSVPDDGTGKAFDDEVGPGHAALFSDQGQDYFTCHYEWAKDRDGRSTLNIFKLAWDRDGWPLLPSKQQVL